MDTSFDRKAWTGASGTLIGFAGAYPETQAYGFVTDPIHAQNVDPNTRRPQAQPAPMGSAASDVLDDEMFGYEGGMYYEGAFGWNMDDIMFPSYDTEPGSKGHESSMGPAQSKYRRGPDEAHAQDVYQKHEPIGYGVNFYGKEMPLKRDLNAWMSSSTPPPNTRQFPAQAREDTGNWPEPFNAGNVAPWRPVDQSTEHIPMRRIPEDDRPVYRYIAVGPMNTIPYGGRWGIQYQSNVPVQNVTPVPMMPQTPMDPWITQEQAVYDQSESPDVFGYSLQ